MLRYLKLAATAEPDPAVAADYNTIQAAKAPPAPATPPAAPATPPAAPATPDAPSKNFAAGSTPWPTAAPVATGGLPAIAPPADPPPITAAADPWANAPTGLTAAQAANPRVSTLTGLPKGYLPGDPLPANASREMQQQAANSTARSQGPGPGGVAPTPQTPGALPAATTPAPAAAPPARIPWNAPTPAAPTYNPSAVRDYSAASRRYQAGFNGNTPDGQQADATAEMNRIYQGSNSLNQAEISGSVLRRNQAMQNSARKPSGAGGYRVGGVGPSGGKVTGIRPASPTLQLGKPSGGNRRPMGRKF